MTTPVLGFIGLGVMGNGMSKNAVRKHGAPVHVFDMSPAALEELRAAGAVVASSRSPAASRSVR